MLLGGAELMLKKILSISFAILLPVIVAIGAYYGTVVTPLLLIGAIAICVVLVASGRIKGNLIYFYIFGMSLSLLYQTTMMGVDVVGSDIHNEFYYAKLNTTQSWDYALSNTDNSSFVIWFIAPLLSKLFQIDMVWVFKVILPIFLAGVPLVLFSIFKRQFGELRAFFATIFFMIIPVFSMEMAQIAKTMVAELFFALMIWVVVSDWKCKYKIIGICIALIMQAICHYTVGVLGICFLLGMFVIRLVSSPLKWSLFSHSKVPLLVITICLIVGIGAFTTYHSLVAKGAMSSVVGKLGWEYVPKVEAKIGEQPTLLYRINIPVVKTQRPSMLNTAVGLDFMDVPIEGKIFRIVQFITQLMVIIGTVKLLFFNRFKVTAEFVGFIGASWILLCFCLFVSGFAAMINISRFYHFSLFFLAPMFVIGCEAIGDVWATCFRSKVAIWSSAILLLTYLFFMSGLSYWLSRSDNTEYMVVPFSWSLSASERGFTPIATKGDIDCVHWLLNNTNEVAVIVSDSNGDFILTGWTKVPTGADYSKDMGALKIAQIYDRSLPRPCYVFLTDWNIRSSSYTICTDVGMRSSKPLRIEETEDGEFQLYGIGLLIEETRPILVKEVYRSGCSIIYQRVTGGEVK
jgi:uncharacterized membrane protein